VEVTLTSVALAGEVTSRSARGGNGRKWASWGG
jgi:hypothetical protein